MDKAALLSRYEAGPDLLRRATEGMTSPQLKARPIEGRWSIIEVLAHLADMEGVYADRVKRVIAEEEPRLLAADENLWLERLAYQERSAEVEIGIITCTRRQLGPILAALPEGAWRRTGTHSSAGVLSLLDLVEKTVSHLEHHAGFIADKRAALGLPAV